MYRFIYLYVHTFTYRYIHTYIHTSIDFSWLFLSCLIFPSAYFSLACLLARFFFVLLFLMLVYSLSYFSFLVLIRAWSISYRVAKMHRMP